MKSNPLKSTIHQQTELAAELYDQARRLPLVCPHGHVDARLFSDPDARFGSPVDLFIRPDHYITRMFYSQGIPLEAMGITPPHSESPEPDDRSIWRTFCGQFHLLRGTPSSLWIRNELTRIFNIDEKPCAANAEHLFNAIAAKLATEDFAPRSLYDRFNIEVLCTTNAATDTLAHHQAIRDRDWNGRILPTFRPDAVIHLETPHWHENIQLLSSVSGIEIINFKSFCSALQQRRTFFKDIGATATDQDTFHPTTAELTQHEVEAIFQRALLGKGEPSDAARFNAHMLMEMARMSIEDGLVMQLHSGSWRNHNTQIAHRFGPDQGGDIPIQVEYTRNLHPLLNKYGNDPRLTLIVFTLDESTYARELAPLAGHYPALKLGPPWWFHDSVNGIARYFDQVMETAGLYNTVGFNDDTRGFCSIPVRHDIWRQASANWLAKLVRQQRIDRQDADEMMFELSIGLARKGYKLQHPDHTEEGKQHAAFI